MLVRETLNPAECSSFVSFGTSNAQIFMYAAGCTHFGRWPLEESLADRNAAGLRQEVARASHR
jgi:hypothetical protein